MGPAFGNFALYAVGLYPLLVFAICVLVVLFLERLVRHWIRNVNLQAQIIEERTFISLHREEDKAGGER